ncbi:squalene/phytoene synthase family protein [Magnetospirillum sp. UT-4]|uniref:squalene/phytoene synthase family protein n=1 Tax=Magnetospirillum sp. UT-4 TaxID=2681467 RepID=UPI00137C7CAF|nr:squalene/phytoene synthase family protein [Magnetospirillum sp. UT-4]CAA7615967.1 conserved exported hypothetical protein [Magnetospirillum sp. UT-4]
MTRAAAATLPATTGKTAGAENFPVASLLLRPALRRQVMAFYRFARHADDVADDPSLLPEDKLARLAALEAGLGGAPGPAVAADLRDALDGDPRLLAHAEQLLQAFRRDALIGHCRDWGDLMAYCRFSAAPVGRFLLDLHGEDGSAHAAADSLCAALQILNHLQDCAVDYRSLGRVYLPLDRLLQAGLDGRDLALEAATPALRHVLDQVLDQVDGLLEQARPLPVLIADLRLRLEASVTLAMAERLALLLRRHDPLAGRVALSPLCTAETVLIGLFRAFLRPA